MYLASYTAITIVDLLFDMMMTMDTSNSPDALIYSCGTVKFLAGNSRLSMVLAQKCTLLTLSTILQKINHQVSETL